MTPQKLVPSCVLMFPPFCDSYGERPLPEPPNTLGDLLQPRASVTLIAERARQAGPTLVIAS